MDLFATLVDGDGDGGSEMRRDETAADHRATPEFGNGRYQVQLGIAWAQLRHLEVANLVLGDETQEFFVSHKFDFVDSLTKVDVNIIEKNVPRFTNRFLDGFNPLDNIIMYPENKRCSFRTWTRTVKTEKTYFVFTDPLCFDSVDIFLLLETVIAVALGNMLHFT